MGDFIGLKCFTFYHTNDRPFFCLSIFCTVVSLDCLISMRHLDSHKITFSLLVSLLH